MPLEKLEKELEKTSLVEYKEERIAKPNEDVIKKVVSFSDEVRRKFGDTIKGILIFGSAAKGEMKKTSDIDVFVIVDDTATKGTETTDKIISQLHLVAAQHGSIHIQTALLTEFWNWIKMGSPELVNYLRYGYPIHDSGFIKPTQRMLYLGLIPPSEETISLKAKSSQIRMKKIEQDMKNMVFDLRYAAFDMIQSTIMHIFKYQADYKDARKYLEKMIQENKITKEDLENFEKLDKLWKDLDHGVIKINADVLKEAIELSKKIVEKFKALLPKEYFIELENE
ncbi:MAG: nucleotidyltransferase domain-containing protein [Candidatus Aenigmarchaeota archaeon]|nr:nucleotidyltransferase domain-containing protein [Candidatus Aenigmarchaeota archaeon]MDW8149612.1 nucleotidyltransferase domain-containing protein [Candidatus Aenigmarchaeota archaeon]